MDIELNKKMLRLLQDGYGDPEKAIKLYVGNEYIQHNPDVEEEKGFIEYFTRMHKTTKIKIFSF